MPIGQRGSASRAKQGVSGAGRGRRGAFQSTQMIRPAETPLTDAARVLHDDLLANHNDSVAMLHANVNRLTPSTRQTIERAVIDPATALIAGEPQAIRESFDTAYDTIANNFNEMMGRQDSSRTVVMASAMTVFAVNVQAMRVLGPHARGSFAKRGRHTDRWKRGGKMVNRRSGSEETNGQDGDERMDGSSSGGEDQVEGRDGLKMRRSGRSAKGKETQGAAGDAEVREEEDVMEEVPELNGQGGVETMEGVQEMEGEDGMKMKKRNTKESKAKDATEHDGAGDAEARKKEGVDEPEKKGEGEEATMDESAREGDVMEEPSTRGLDRADKEGLDGGETKGEEAIRDQPSMDELKPEGLSTEVPEEEQPLEEREGGERDATDGMEKGEGGDEEAAMPDGSSIDASPKAEVHEEKMIEESQNGVKGDEESMELLEEGGGKKMEGDNFVVDDVIDGDEKTKEIRLETSVFDAVEDVKKADLGDEKSQEVRENNNGLMIVDDSEKADNGDEKSQEVRANNGLNAVDDCEKAGNGETERGLEKDQKSAIVVDETVEESTIESNEKIEIDGDREGVDPRESDVKEVEGDDGEAVRKEESVEISEHGEEEIDDEGEKNIDGKKEEEEGTTLESNDKTEDDEHSMRDPIEGAKEGEEAIPDESEAKPIDESENRDKDNHEAPTTDEGSIGGIRSVIEADDNTVDSPECREGDVLLEDPSMDVSEERRNEDQMMEDGEELEDEDDEEEMDDEEDLSERTFVGSEEGEGVDDQDHFIYGSNDEGGEEYRHDGEELPPFLLPFNEDNHDGEEVVLMAEEEEIQTAYFEEEVEVDEGNDYYGGRRLEEGEEAMEEGEVEGEEEESSEGSARRPVTYRMSDSGDSSDGGCSPPRHFAPVAAARGRGGRQMIGASVQRAVIAANPREGPPTSMMDRMQDQQGQQGQQGGPAPMRRHQ